MLHNRSNSGAAYLHERSRIAGQRLRLPPTQSVLLLSADQRDSAALQATLHLLLGYDLSLHIATTLGAALDRLTAGPCDLILLDDRLPPGADPLATLSILRNLGGRAPVVVIRSRRDRDEDRALQMAGAGDILHRDDLTASRITQAMLRIADAST